MIQPATYVNKFQMMTNSKRQEVMISFYQEQPVWDNQSNSVTEVVRTDIASLFISMPVARAIADALNDFIKDFDAQTPTAGE